MELRSVAALIEASRKMPIWEAILCSDLEEDTPEQRAASLEKMRMLWQVMQDSAAGYDGSQRSLSGLSGGDGEKYTQMMSSGKMMCGTYLNDAIATALKVSECNACMKRIVAAPTAGSCGVIPAVLIPYRKEYPDTPEEEMLHALYVPAALEISLLSGHRFPVRKPAVRQRSEPLRLWQQRHWSTCGVAHRKPAAMPVPWH